jgi:hypothetical protein
VLPILGVWLKEDHARATAWKMLATQAAEMPDWPLSPPKIFKPKYQLPLIEDYKTEAPAEFWEIFPDREPGAGHSLVSEQRLREAQIEAKLEAGPDFEAVLQRY